MAWFVSLALAFPPAPPVPPSVVVCCPQPSPSLFLAGQSWPLAAGSRDLSRVTPFAWVDWGSATPIARASFYSHHVR
eukprot:6957017-Pyramimonas_sp.AAC.1